MFDFKNLVSLSLLFSIILTSFQAEAGKRKISDVVDQVNSSDHTASKPKRRRVSESQGEESSQDTTTQSTEVQIIKGYEEHRDLLVDMLKRAQEEILISSKSISYQTYEIYTAFKEAINRGVKIWVYADNSETSLSDDDFCDFLENNGSFLEFLNIHAKFLIIDGKSSNGQAVIGSHNWLSEMDDSQGVNGDSSILISDPDAVKRLRGKTFQTAIKYNDRASALLTPNIPNVTSIQDEINRIQLAEFSIGDMTFKYLTTLGHHEEFLRNFASIAEERLVIYSPFYYEDSAKKRLGAVFSLLKPNARLVLHINKKDRESLLKLGSCLA